MVNKKGWIRVVEATIMVFLIISVLIFVSREKNIETTPDINDLLHKVIDEIAKDDKERGKIINSKGDENSYTNFLKDKIPSYLYYDLEICDLNEDCKSDLNEIPTGEEKNRARESLKKSDVYVSERILGEIDVSSDVFSIKRIRLYAWRK